MITFANKICENGLHLSRSISRRVSLATEETQEFKRALLHSVCTVRVLWFKPTDLMTDIEADICMEVNPDEQPDAKPRDASKVKYIK